MTRAQQTISLGLLVSSVWITSPPPLLCPLASLAGTTHTTYLVANLSTTQLYLALFLGLIPLPALVQEHVVPVVRRSHLLPSFPTMATYATYGSLEC